MITNNLMKSMVSNRIWKLQQSDPAAFKREVTQYFARGYPDWRVVRADPKTKTIYLRDERVK